MQPGTVDMAGGMTRGGLRLGNVMLALALLYLWRMGAAPLFDVDEGAFAEATREMLASGDWGHTFLNGADRFDKPILVYWFQALSMAIFGINEWAARLPSALWMLGATWAVGRAVGREQGNHAGALSALVLGSAMGFLAMGRAATADGLLNALIILTSLQLWRFAQTRAASALYWAYFWTALGLLAKGPVAVLVPGGALFLWSVFSDRGRTAWAALWAPRAWFLALVVAGPWYAYALNRHGMAFIEGFFLKHNVERFSGAMEGHSGSIVYYLVVWPLLCLPWAPLMAGVVWRAKSFWQTPNTRFLMIWALWVLVFFSLSGTKLPHYLMYGTAPMLLLMAQVLLHAGQAWRALVWAGIIATTLGLAVSGEVVQIYAPLIEDAWYRQLLQSAPDAQQVAMAGGVGALVVLLLGLWGYRANAAPVGVRLLASVVMGMGVYTTLVFPWWGDAMQGPIKAAGEAIRAADVPAVQWRTHHPSVAFYAQRIVPRREPVVGEWGLTLSTKRNSLPPTDVISESRGVLLVTPR